MSLTATAKLPAHDQAGTNSQLDARPGSVTSVVFIGPLVELILQVGSCAGFAMAFAPAIAAILWSLGTW